MLGGCYNSMVIGFILMMIYFICRRHPSPTSEMLEPLIQTAAAVGLSLDVTSSKALADSLDRAVVSWPLLGFTAFRKSKDAYLVFTILLKK